MGQRFGSGGFGLLAMLAAAALMTGPAQAQDADPEEQGLNIQHFMPAPGGELNFVHVHGAQSLDPYQISAGLYGIYAYRPLRITSPNTGELVDVVRQLAQVDAQFAIGLPMGLQLGIAAPFTVYQAPGDSLEPIRAYKAQAAGDIRIVPKMTILGGDGESPLSLAGLVTVMAPTGAEQNLQGDENWSARPEVALEWRFSSTLRAGVNLGYQIRAVQDLDTVDVGNEIVYGLGVAWAAVPDSVTILGEAYGRVSADPRAALELENAPLEAQVAARLNLAKRHRLTIGAGPGIVPGYGVPVARAYISCGLAPAGEDPDTDGDGIKDSKDNCPEDPEDFDGFQDDDGCPEADNDKDGLLDGDDQCPNDAEDKDDFEDEDGCPDLDNDQDGITDANDQCPNDPEDLDGIGDDDGCPEDDFDGDGILDPDDKCPTLPEVIDGIDDEDGCPDEAKDTDGDGNPDETDECPKKPEDIDGFEDADGCPDDDNDGDRILDVKDQCPNEAEDYDGTEDKDGCPDVAASTTATQDFDLDGTPDSVDKCPKVPETYNGYKDTDGCPDTAPDPQAVEDPKGSLEQIWVFFATNSNSLTPQAKEQLDRAAELLIENPQITRIRIGGHADSTGNAAYNAKLSERRMATVRDYLVTNGVAKSRMVTGAYGSTRPVASNNTQSGRAMNRRVQMTILEIDEGDPDRNVLPTDKK